ncbi:MAG: hypothetical protein J6T74_09165 [Clostridia bacterium]|nr:hypothetical protein [Clostridia bacterium]
MNNFEKLLNSKNKNVIIFANTIQAFKNSQVFYSRLFRSICEQDTEELNNLIKILKKQNFSDTLDVVMWLEA